MNEQIILLKTDPLNFFEIEFAATLVNKTVEEFVIEAALEQAVRINKEKSKGE